MIKLTGPLGITYWWKESSIHGIRVNLDSQNLAKKPVVAVLVDRCWYTVNESAEEIEILADGARAVVLCAGEGGQGGCVEGAHGGKGGDIIIKG